MSGSEKIIKAVYPGSFDPPTYGHLDIIERSAKLFTDLTVLIAKSSTKSGVFTPEERKKLLEASIGHIKGVRVDIYQGLTVDYLKEKNAQVIVRGLRAVSEFEYELQMATMNRRLFPDVETVIVMTGEKFYFVASSLVKEVAAHGGDVSQLVPPVVEKALKEKFKK